MNRRNLLIATLLILTNEVDVKGEDSPPCEHDFGPYGNWTMIWDMGNNKCMYAKSRKCNKCKTDRYLRYTGTCDSPPCD